MAQTQQTRSGIAGGLLRALTVLLLGGAVVVPYARSSATRSDRAIQPQQTTNLSGDGKSAAESTPKPAPHTEAPALLAEFAGEPMPSGEPLTLKDVSKVATSLGNLGVTVEFVIATLPDPIDSNARWLFDPMMESIQRAAAASGFVLDRFYIPDSTPERDASDHASTLKSTHEKWPGIVLFRDAAFGNDPPTRRLLLVFLVTETATSGIHLEALHNAVTFVRDWQQQTGRQSDIRVLGPNFSGSVPSLAIGINRFTTQSFRIVSGGATAPENRAKLERLKDPHVTFRATVLPDDFARCHLIQYLINTDPSLASGATTHMALLYEGNTTYGQSLGKKKEETPTASDANAACKDVSDVGSVLDRARRLPFPLHISRLRSVAQSVAPQPSTTGPRFLSIPLADTGPQTDQIPALTPASTSSSVELIVANILDTIEREHITTVGLLATDTRDKLFLAEQIARRDSSVRLFTLESDLFFVHPDYSRYLRGMIVGSTYPLFSQTQRLSGRTELAQFPTTNAQGVYNAMIALLNYHHDGKAVRDVVAPPLDYITPVAHAANPPLWISVVGIDALWPLKWYPADDSSTMGYLQPIQPPVEPDRADLSTRVSLLTRVGFIALLIAFYLHIWGWRRAFRRTPGRPTPLDRVFTRRRLKLRLPYVFVTNGVLWIASMLVAFGLWQKPDLWHPSARGIDEWFEWFGVGATVVAAAGLAIVTGHLGYKALPKLFATMRRRFTRSRVLASTDVLGPIGLLSALLSLVFLTIYLAPNRTVGGEGSIHYFERLTHPGNGVSPAVSFGLLLGAIYVWCLAHLQRLFAAPPPIVRRMLSTFDGLNIHGYRRTAHALIDFLNRPLSCLPWWLGYLVGAAALLVAYVGLAEPLVTHEPIAFTRAFKAGWVCAHVVLVAGFAQAFGFWKTIRDALDVLSRTPLLAAFERLPQALLHDRLSPRAPDETDLQRPLRLAHQLGLQLDVLAHHDDRSLSTRRLKLSSELHQELRDALLACGDQLPRPSGRTWAYTDAWRRLRQAGAVVSTAIAASWKNVPRANILDTANFDSDVTGIKDDVQQWYLRAEELVAMELLLVVRDLLARLISIFFFIIVAVLMLVVAQQSFPFQPRQVLLAMAWVDVVVAVFLILRTFIQMEHHPVLSAISSTKAGAITWDATLWSKLFIYGLIPLATIFAAQFPQIGSDVLRWLTPVQSALP